MSAISTESGLSVCRNSAFARITASGVRSSCEAWATNACWRSNASCSGASDLPARNQPPTAATIRLPAPAISSSTSRVSSASFTGSSDRATWIATREFARMVYTRSGPALERIVRMSVAGHERVVHGRSVGEAEIGRARVGSHAQPRAVAEGDVVAQAVVERRDLAAIPGLPCDQSLVRGDAKTAVHVPLELGALNEVDRRAQRQQEHRQNPHVPRGQADSCSPEHALATPAFGMRTRGRARCGSGRTPARRPSACGAGSGRRCRRRSTTARSPRPTPPRAAGRA